VSAPADRESIQTPIAFVCKDSDMPAQSTTTQEDTMTINEVAAYLRLHPLTVRRLAREGTLPAYKVGRRWQIGRATSNVGF
jgi:excisionase family DNA binding protein